MINITVIIPSPELYESAGQAFAECGTPEFVDYKIIHAHGSHVMSMNLGDADFPDIIVARGMTFQAIARMHPDRTVVKLPIGAYDVLRAIHECRKRYGAAKIAFIDTGSELDDAATLREMMGLELWLFKAEDEQGIRTALRRAEELGAEAVIGGFTACIMAGEAGFKNALIPTSRETLRDAVREAISTAGVMLNERTKAEISNAILQNTRDAILYFGENGKLSLFNRGAYELLRPGGKSEAFAGKAASELFADPEIASLVERREERYGVIKTINDNLLIADFIPIRVAARVIGELCSFQRANDIQATESKIRRQLNRKGLVARYGFDDIIHTGAALAETIQTARKYARVDSNVLLLGETGTGKELFAQSIHRASRRAEGPFVAANCAAFNENLLESELFGYSGGAFTGASKHGRTGLFELAHGGTLFLDEIGEIPMSLQATLLRALQEGEIRRVGDDKVVPVDVRIIAATNVDLQRQAAAGRFRKDLLYRLDVLSLGIPPLRARVEDIRHIANHYIRHYRSVFAKPGLKLSNAAWAALEEYDWPGNTRELRNVCERLVVLGENGATISRETVRKTLSVSVEDESSASAQSTQNTPDAQEGGGAEVLVQLINALKMNKADLAESLGMSRTTLWRKQRKMKQNVAKL